MSFHSKRCQKMKYYLHHCPKSTLNQVLFTVWKRRNLDILAIFGHGGQIWPILSTTDLEVVEKYVELKIFIL